MGKRRLTSFLFPSVLLYLLTTGQAMAHHQPPGMEDVDEFAGEPFTAALAHPFTGTDHWLAAVAVGLMVWACGRRTGIQGGMVFLLAMGAGIAAGRSGWQVPLMESGLAVSVILAGGVVLGGHWFSNRAVITAAAVTGMWHGIAHGMEMPATVPTSAYALGLVLGSGGIVLLAGVLATRFLEYRPVASRWAGGGLAAAGTWLLVTGFTA